MSKSGATLNMISIVVTLKKSNNKTIESCWGTHMAGAKSDDNLSIDCGRYRTVTPPKRTMLKAANVCGNKRALGEKEKLRNANTFSLRINLSFPSESRWLGLLDGPRTVL